MQIGEWLINAGLNELSRADEVVRLEPKVMEVLIFLVSRPDEVVSRESLLTAIWPGVIVGDDALTQAMIKLRKALGDDPKQPRYIQTVPKRGYRLLATVTPAATAGPVTTPTRQQQGSHQYALILAAVGLGLLLIVAWAGLRHDKAPEISAARPKVSELGLVIEPFRALESTPQSLCLATGLTSELTSDLSRLSAVRVFTATDTGIPAGVDYKVEGVVQHVEHRLRIHVHLIDNHSGQEIWSERFDRPTRDLLDVQSELSNHLMNVLPLKLNEMERRRAAHRYTRSLEAYELFLHGQTALLARSAQENEMARDYYQQAIRIDPAFARAYAGLALTFAAEYRNQWTQHGKDVLARAFEMAQTARELDPDIPETYWALGFVYAQRRDYTEALTQLSRATQLNPSYADAYALMGGIDTYLGEPDKSLPLLRTAQRLNPDSGYLYFLLLGRAYYFLNDYEQARTNLTEASTRNEGDLEAHVYLAAVLERLGDASGAGWEKEEIETLQPGFRVMTWLSTYPIANGVLRQSLAADLNRLGF